MSILLIPHEPGTHVGIEQRTQFLMVLSSCCGAPLDDRQINKDGIKCSACENREPMRKLPDLRGKEVTLGRFIQVSEDPDNSETVRWWLHGWTGLECDVEVAW